jgi:hypothetical protein
MAEQVLFVRADDALVEAIVAETKCVPRGAKASRSEVVRVLLWEAIRERVRRRERRKPVRQEAER